MPPRVRLPAKRASEGKDTGKRDAASRRLSLFAAGFMAAATCLSATPASAKNGAIEVDVELVLAVDISYSMDPEEQTLQRQGYVEALNSPIILDAIKKGLNGKIAVAYVEWAGNSTQEVVVDWQIIDSPESARSFTAALQAPAAPALPDVDLQRAGFLGAAVREQQLCRHQARDRRLRRRLQQPGPPGDGRP